MSRREKNNGGQEGGRKSHNVATKKEVCSKTEKESDFHINAFNLMIYSTKVENVLMKVTIRASVIAKGDQVNGLYILDESTIISHAIITCQSMKDKTRLWHLRLGHTSEKGPVELEKQQLLMGDKLHKLEL